MVSAEQREPHPLQGFVAEGEAQKKRLSQVNIKVTKDLLSEVRQTNNTDKRASLKSVAPVAKQDLLSEVRQPVKRASLKQTGGPVAKQELLSAVRTEAGVTKKRLSQVGEKTKNIAGLMSELRTQGSSE